MSGDLAATCWCVGDCKCLVAVRSKEKEMQPMKKLKPAKNDKDYFNTDYNLNREESNPDSLKLGKNTRNFNLDKRRSEINYSSSTWGLANASTSVQSNKTFPPRIKPKPVDLIERTFLHEPKKLHVLQPHPHRRHYNHHLLDHFSSDEMLLCRETTPRRDVWREITPTLTSCEYKDTNFLTEGSPPAVRRFQSSKKSSQTNISASESDQSISSYFHNQSHPSLPASLWKEPNYAPEVSEESINGCASKENQNKIQKKSFEYLNKYKNECVSGPGNGSGRSKYDKHQGNTLDPGYVKSCVKAWDQQTLSRTQYLRESSKSIPSSSSLRKRTKKDYESKVNSSRHSSCSSATDTSELSKEIRITTKKIPPKSLKLTVCQTCLNRNSIIKNDVSVQTEFERNESKSTQQSQTDEQPPAEVELKKFPNLDDFMYDNSSSADCSRNLSPSDEVTSAGSFDDEELDNLYDCKQATNYFKNDLQSRIIAIQHALQTLRYNISTYSSEENIRKLVLNLSDELDQIVSEIYELYDDFDSDSGQDQREIDEIKKQLQQYKRTCRILEYELMRADIKAGEKVQVDELQEEIRLGRHVAVSLNRELQSADEKVQKVQIENDRFRQRFAELEIQRSVLQREVIALRNKVDQLSLHASAVPPHDGGKRIVRDTLPELQHEIKFLNEEKQALLVKLVEVDKAKEHLQEHLERYREQYGDVSLSDRFTAEEEKKTNDLKIRLLMAEDQAGALGRKTMQLQLENENLLQQLARKTKTETDMSRNPSSSDLLFLEDEVEALRTTLEEMEDENRNLKQQIQQSTEQIANKPAKKNFRWTQTELHGLSTPSPTSEKIAAWDVSAEVTTPQSLHSESLLTASGIEFKAETLGSPYPIVIDEATQTVNDQLDDTDETLSDFEIEENIATTPIAIDEATQTLNYEEENLILYDQPWVRRKPSPTTVSKQLVDILTRSKEVDVEFLVSQLTDLALATRNLVEESPSEIPMHETLEEYSLTFVTTPVKTPVDDAAQSKPEIPRLFTPMQPVHVKQIDSSKTTTSFNIFHFLLVFLLICNVVNHLPLIQLIKLIFLAMCFFMI